MSNITKKNFDHPDKSSQPVAKVKEEEITVGGKTFKRGTLQAGWKWSKDLGPVVGSNSCQVEHLRYIISGSFMVKMDSGEEMRVDEGDIVFIPPGHDGWGIGDKPTVWLDIPQ